MTSVMTADGGGSGTAASFTGSLDEVPLAAVMRRIAVEERSGDLHVTTPAFSKTVHFDRGFVVFASSDVKDDRLGESLIAAGRISRHEFALASMLMKTTQRKFGNVLVEAGIVGEEELGRLVATQVNRIVLSLFLAKEGRYEFEERPCSVPVELMVSLSVYRILMDGVRRMSKKSLVLAGLPPLDTEVRIVDQPPFTLDIGKLRADEKSVLRAARNGATLRDIVEIVDGNEGITLRACYGLLSGGILEPVELDPRRRQLQVQEETGTFVLSEIRHKVQVPAEPVEAPRPRPTPAPAAPPPPAARTAEPPPTPVETSGGFTLGDLYEWFARVWRRVRGWFGGSREASLEEDRPTIAPAATSPSASADSPPAPQPAQSEPAPPVESIGVPSWSQKDDDHEPQGEEAEVGAATLSPPSWSLKNDEPAGPDEESDVLGVPSWSMKDPEPIAPSALTAKKSSPEPSAPEPEPEPSPRSEPLEPPAWSIVDAPRPSTPDEPEPPAPVRPEPPAPVDDVPLDTTQTLDVESYPDEDPLPDLDNELFVDAPGADDDAASMLRQIPIEDVELSQDLEIEVELEADEFPETPEIPIGAEALPGTPEAPVEPLPDRAEPLPEIAVSPEEPSPLIDAAPAEVSEPPAPASPPEPQPAHAQPRPAAAEISRADEVEEPEEAAPKGPAYEQEMRRMKQSGGEERLLRDVKLHFRMRDFRGAVPLLEQLVAISPGKALYRGMLARAMSRDPSTRKDAEEQYIEALRLSPQDPELHYWLGLYYKSFGLKSRAITEFRTTLRINPKHEGARKQLGGGPKKDDALGNVLKKLFG